MGDTQNYEHRGVAPKSLGQIFNEINSRLEFEYRVSCTYMEIYNEKFFDLLQDLSLPDQINDFTIVEEKDGRGVFVRGLNEIEVKNENEALNLLFSGELARTTATHKLNRKSNRSHSIFTIYLQQRQRSGVSEKVCHSKLHLIDLAGSERLKKTMDGQDGPNTDGVLKRESMNINQSLSYLEQCVIALTKRGSHVPYRQSKLTNILKDTLGANCNTLMISCIWGEVDHLEETISTLRLSSRMMKVENETVAIETIDSSALIKKQAKLIKALKQELFMHDALVERTGIAYDPYTPEQQISIQQMIERYISSKESEEDDILNINSYRQMIEICKQFKKIVLSSRNELILIREETINGLNIADKNARSITAGAFGASSIDFEADSKFVEDYNPLTSEKVGESASAKFGFSLGQSNSESKPVMIEGVSKYMENKNFPDKSFSSSIQDSKEKVSHLNKSFGKFDLSEDKSVSESTFLLESNDQVFQNFIHGEGEDTYNSWFEQKKSIKDTQSKLKEYTVILNVSKDKIDSLQNLLELRKSSRIEMLRKSKLKPSETEDIVDEEEFKIMKELKEEKRSYKNAFEQLQKLKNTFVDSKRSLEQKKKQLSDSFISWNGAQSKKMPFNVDSNFEETSDILDDQEAFDRLEVERVMANDPNSLAFFQAQKTRRALITQSGSNIKIIQKNKRLN